ncbi:MAG: diphosphomevalonate/mevalonate 3,5-bisphosphate decarboxylase family protein [Flavobacteriales bacterium AspAUS03]
MDIKEKITGNEILFNLHHDNYLSTGILKEYSFKAGESTYPRTRKGKVTAKSPSNIALIKYWGKYPKQIPANPSISYTLRQCHSETQLYYQFQKNRREKFSVQLLFAGEIQPKFLPKILDFFEKILPYCPYLYDFDFIIKTNNTFPHSSGIASSASAMSALALCLLQLEQKLGHVLSTEDCLQKASFLSMLGSGSACRSIYPGLVIWGAHKAIKGSDDYYAIPYPYEIHEAFSSFQDTILLIDEGVKKVSSSQGHELMQQHPYAQKRFESAYENLERLIPILKTGDLESFGELVEHEALSLHAMMMCSRPYFILMKPDTLQVIEKVWDFRIRTGKPLYFTLDAGANVHLLYPTKEKEMIHPFIHEELLLHCQRGHYIEDSCGYS